MAEPVKKIDYLKVIEGDRPEQMSLDAAALLILNHVQGQIDEGVDPAAIRGILNGLEALLRSLPRRPRILELFPESEATASPEERKGHISDRLRVIREDLNAPESIPVSEPLHSDFQPFLQEQRRLFRLEAELVLRAKQGENIAEQLAAVSEAIVKNRALWETAVREANEPKIDPSRRAELDRLLLVAYDEQIAVEGPKPSSLSPKRREEEQEEEIRAWMETKLAQTSRTTPETAMALPKKREFYPFRQETEMVKDRAIAFFKLLSNKEADLRGELRQIIAEGLRKIVLQPTVPAFLKALIEVNSNWMAALAELQYREDHPLFGLEAEVIQFQQHLPKPHQFTHCNISKVQMNSIKSEIQQHLSKFNEGHKTNVEDLLDEIQARSEQRKNKTGPTKSPKQKAKEARNRDGWLDWKVRPEKRRRDGHRNKW